MSFYGGEQFNVGQVLSGYDIEEPMSGAASAAYQHTLYTNPYTTLNRIGRRNLLDYTPESVAEFEAAQNDAIGDEFADTPVISDYGVRRPIINRAQAEKIAEEAGVDPKRLPADEQEHSEEYWKDLVQSLSVKQEYEKRMMRADQGVGYYAATLGVGILAFAQDPINVSTFMLPVVGASTRVAATAQAAGRIGRLGVRGGIGVLEGVAAAAAIEPIYYGLTTQEDADYTMATALTNIAIGGAFGAVINPVISPIIERGFVRQQVSKILDDVEETLITATKNARERAQAGLDLPVGDFPRAEVPVLKSAVAEAMRRVDRQTMEVVMRAAVNQLIRGERVDVMKLVNSSSRVETFLQRIRNTDTQVVLEEILMDGVREWTNQFNLAARLSKPQRQKVAANIEAIKKQMAELAKLREELKRGNTARRGDIKEQLAAVKQDKRYADQQKKLQSELSDLKKTLNESKVSKDAHALLNRLASGELLEQAMQQTDDLLNTLKYLVPENKSDFHGTQTAGRNYKGGDRVMDRVNQTAERATTKNKMDQDRLIDAETEELRVIVEDEVGESGMASIRTANEKIDQAVESVGRIIDDFKACRTE